MAVGLCMTLAVMPGCSLFFGDAETMESEKDAATVDANTPIPDAASTLDGGTPRLVPDPQFAGCGEALEGFAKRTQIVIDYQLTATQMGYPLLVPIPPDVLSSMELKADASDLRFTNGAGTPLTHEIELLDPSGTSFVWVAMTLGQSVCSKSIWMYSDNPGAIPLDEEEVRKTWSSALGVWHFADDGDSQKNSANGSFIAQKRGQQASLSIVGDGVIGHAQRNSIFDVDLDPGLDIADESTWEARFFLSNADIENQQPVSFQGIIMLMAIRSSELNKDFRTPAAFIRETSTLGTFVVSPTEIGVGWHYMALTIADLSEGVKEANLYLDGELVPVSDDGNLFGSIGLGEATGQFGLGLGAGDIDEVRLSTVVRPSSWIQLNQRAFEGSLIQFSTTDPVAGQ